MILYGASGHGKVIHDILKSQDKGMEITFVDDADKGTSFYGCPLQKSQDIKVAEPLIIAIGNNVTRKKIAENYQNFSIAIHSSAVISPTVQMGEGTVIMANVSCNADTRIGKHVILNTSASIDHDCEIADFAHISPHASLAGNVSVGEGAHVGIGACVIQGMKIGKYAVVGAGSVIINDVPDYATVVGNPARIIKTENL